MTKKQYNLVLLGSLLFCFSGVQAARFIQTNKLAGSGRAALQLREGDDIVSLKINNGVPIARMRITNLQELIIEQGRYIKVEVFKTTNDPKEFVGIFSYRIKPRQNTRRVRIPLPRFENQSENFEFIVYDTAGTPRARYAYSFAAAELINNEEPTDPIDPELNGAVTPEMMEAIVRNINVQSVQSTQLAGIEKVGDTNYTIKIPTGRRENYNSIGKRVSSLKINGTGTLAERSRFDDASIGFVYFDKETGKVYIKGRETGAWSEPVDLSGKNLDLSAIDNGQISIDKLSNGDILQTIINNPVVAADLGPINQSINNLSEIKLNADLSNLPAESVDGEKIMNGSITTDDLAPDAISFTGDRYITLLPGVSDIYYDNQFFINKGCGIINSSQYLKFLSKRIAYAYCLPTYSVWSFQIPTDWEVGTDMAAELEWFTTSNSALGPVSFINNTSWSILYKDIAPGDNLPSSFDASTANNDTEANTNLIQTLNTFTSKSYTQSTPTVFNEITSTGTNLIIDGADIVPGSTIIIGVKRDIDNAENNFFNAINLHKVKIIYKSKHVK